MATGVKQPDGTICRKGPDCKRHGNKTVSLADAVKQQKEKLTQQPNVKPPVLVAPQPLVAPYITGELNAEDVRDWVGYDYDYADCDGCYGCDTGDDYCRGRRYAGLHVVTPTAEDFVASMFRTKKENVPSEFAKLAREAGVEDEENWDVEADWGYYGQEVGPISFSGDVSKLRKILDNYWKLDNAVDAEGILPYLRDKGQETKGMKPEAAVKSYLTTKYGSKNLPARVKNASTCFTMTANSRYGQQVNVVYDQQRLDSVKAKAPESYQNFHHTGIFVQKNSSTYVLVDGYEEFKYFNGKVRGGNPRMIVLK